MTATLRFLVLVALVACLGALVAVFGVPDSDHVAKALHDTAVPVPVIAVLACAVLVAGLVPRTALAAVAGLLFGPWEGGVYIIVGAAIGASVAFAVGRWLGRDFVAKQRRVQRLDGWLTRRGMLGVMLVRMLPVAPFGMVSYAFGTSGVRPIAYLIGTVLGMLPSTTVYVNLGAHATSPGTPGFWISAAAAVLLWVTTLSATAWLGRRDAARAAQRASADAHPSPGTSGDGASSGPVENSSSHTAGVASRI